MGKRVFQLIGNKVLRVLLGRNGGGKGHVDATPVHAQNLQNYN